VRSDLRVGDWLPIFSIFAIGLRAAHLGMALRLVAQIERPKTGNAGMIMYRHGSAPCRQR
jgi:hypothetical protein